MYPSPSQQSQQNQSVAQPKNDETGQNSISTLVMLCSSDIAKCHETQFTDPKELIDKLIKDPSGNFRTDFEALYLSSNLYILQTQSALEIEYNKKIIGFLEVSNDIETWLSFREYTKDFSPTRALNEGIILFNIYTRMLVQCGLYDPRKV